MHLLVPERRLSSFGFRVIRRYGASDQPCMLIAVITSLPGTVFSRARFGHAAPPAFNRPRYIVMYSPKCHRALTDAVTSRLLSLIAP
jgi:hypothetical protein